MKPLSLTLKKNGFEYVQLFRGSKSCIYEQRYSENIKYYEVFIIKINPERTFKGKIIEEREAFPNNEAFGAWAWSYLDYNKALKKFNELEKKSINENRL
jgi:hypothetical protein